jgi:hypothetical protein
MGLVALYSRSPGVIADHYVWLTWSSAFLVPWLIAYTAFPHQRQEMVWASLVTAPLGLTEPLFVPAYWSPPSVFDLARTTGFDLESIIFSFGIGGIGAVLYNVLTGGIVTPVPAAQRHLLRHKLHYLALAVPFLMFPLLSWFRWNPIYPAILAMALGAIATMLCRPDLVRKTWVGAFLFLAYYSVFLLGVEWTAPGYIARVWNLKALSGVGILGIPLEELLFAAAFGAYWSSLYEHFTWRRLRHSGGTFGVHAIREDSDNVARVFVAHPSDIRSIGHPCVGLGPRRGDRA